jgi:hypothetical protein
MRVRELRMVVGVGVVYECGGAKRQRQRRFHTSRLTISRAWSGESEEEPGAFLMGANSPNRVEH